MDRKGYMWKELAGWVIGAVVVLIILTFFVRGFYREIFGIGLDFAEKAKPAERYQGGDSSAEERELGEIQERFMQDLRRGSGSECLMRYSLRGLGDRTMEFLKSSSGTRISEIIMEGEGRQQRVNMELFGGEICIINAPNFCRSYRLGRGCRGDSPSKPLYKSIPATGLRITEEDIFVPTSFGEQEFLINREYIFKAEEGKYCFIPQHSNALGFGDCIDTAHTIHVKCNENLVSAVGLC